MPSKKHKSEEIIGKLRCAGWIGGGGKSPDRGQRADLLPLAQGIWGSEDGPRLLSVPQRQEHIGPADDRVDRSPVVGFERLGHGVVSPMRQVVAVDDQQRSLG